MPDVSFKQILEIIVNFGVSGIVLFIWWLSDRQNQRQIAENRAIMEQYRNDMLAIQKQFEKRHEEICRMYENNVDLVKRYIDINDTLKDIVILNTQKWQQAQDSIIGNQFCPNVRLTKKAEGWQG